MLVRRDSSFYLLQPRAIGAKYKVLWASVDKMNPWDCSRACKVDILTPGTMNIPHVPLKFIVTIDGFPVIPMIPLLLLKLQAWSDHVLASQAHQREKQYTDVEDIKTLLEIAIRRGENLRYTFRLPRSFVDSGRMRIAAFSRAVESSKLEKWRMIGFYAGNKYHRW